MPAPIYVCMWEPGVAPSLTRPTPAMPLAGPFPSPDAARPFLASARARALAEAPARAACAFGLAYWCAGDEPAPRYPLATLASSGA